VTKKDVKERAVRVGLISLGCAKNLVDAEIMLGSLLRDGVEITNNPALADVMIVNTCSFIDSAQEESVDTILESAEVREAKNRGQGLIVSGCLPQRFRDELPRLFPEVDAFMGIDQVAQVADIVRQAMAGRQERLAAKAKPQTPNTKKLPEATPREQINARLEQVEQARANGPRGESKAVRGTEKFGRTKTVVTPPHPASSIQHPTSPPLVDVHPRPNFIPDFATPRFRLTPRHFAYVKIAEGCNHPCSFCIIPRMRGSHRSRQQSDLVAEAKALLADGVKELNLISQDSTYYGIDLRPNHSRAISSPDKFTAATKSLAADATTICTLLRELNSLPGDFWIRLLYTHPAHWTDELIQTIAACPKVARYVDIPLQHIHENMLQRMRRETSQPYIVELLRRIRAGVPGIALRTTFIVGFPGETEACFARLLDFIRETKFERLGVFAYSQEEGTLAGRMAAQIPSQTKNRRRDLAMTAQHEVAVQIAESFVGRTITVLVEGEATARQLQNANVSSWEHGLIRQRATGNADLETGRFLIARGEADAPDIDGRVYVRGKVPLHEFARVKIIGHTDYDLIAKPVIELPARGPSRF
jgi:ribosomal protein S12 methylthiotransferase